MLKAILYPFSGLQKDLGSLWRALRFILVSRMQVQFAYLKFLWRARRLSEPAQAIDLMKTTRQMRYSPPFGTCDVCTKHTTKLLHGLHRDCLHETVQNPLFGFGRRRKEGYIRAVGLQKLEGEFYGQPPHDEEPRSES